MIPTSLLFQQSMAFSRTIFTELDIVKNGVVLENNVPIVSGTVTTDRGSNTRYSAGVTLAMYSWDVKSLPLKVDGTRVRLRTGLTSIGLNESIQVGEYLAWDYKNTYDGQLALDLKGLEQLVIQDRFIQPRTPPYGQSTVDTITQLITESVPDAQVIALNSQDKAVTDTSAWEKERWDTITGLAASISAEVFCGYDGRWYIVDAPDVANLVPIYSVIAGPTDAAVVIAMDDSLTRDGVFNAWSVSGQSSDPNIPACWGFAADTDPTSPTFYGGDNKVVGFYSSQFFTSDDQCIAYAQRKLAESLAFQGQMNLSSGPIPLLEAGDAVGTSDPAGVAGPVHLLQQTTLQLDTTAWNAVCLTTGSTASGDGA